MAFLDNSGDIILDAVLTDTGRMRLAKGDGSFRIVKFGLGDDEIDYSLFNKSHTSGSAYFDLEIMQTPVLEAFTNNASSMKHKLINFSRTDLLYLPVIKLNTLKSAYQTVQASVDGQGMFFVTTDADTTDKLPKGVLNDSVGIFIGDSANYNTDNSRYIRLDQGIDNIATSNTKPTDGDLTETSYIIQVDNRFGTILNPVNGDGQTPSFIDDDNIAAYYFSQGQETDIVSTLKTVATVGGVSESSIAGNRGTMLTFRLRASTDLEASTFLFTQVGGGNTITISDGSDDQIYYYIDSNIRITGATTGYAVDVPVRFLKWQAQA